MTEKIKNIFTLPVAITSSVGIISILTGLLALIFHYLPAVDKNELSATNRDTGLEYRLSVIEGKQKKTDDRIDVIIGKIEDVENQGKIILKYMIKLNEK